MFRQHPYKFLVSIVASFFVHAAAVFAMLSALPEISPPEIVRPISVTLVPESSLPGTGIQQDVQTDDMGSQPSSTPAVSNSPDEATSETEEYDTTENVFEYELELEAVEHETVEVDTSDRDEVEPLAEVESEQIVDNSTEATEEPIPSGGDLEYVYESIEVEVNDLSSWLPDSLSEQISQDHTPPEFLEHTQNFEISSAPTPSAIEPKDISEQSEVHSEVALIEETPVIEPTVTEQPKLPIVTASLFIPPAKTIIPRDGTDEESELVTLLYLDSFDEVRDKQLPAPVVVTEPIQTRRTEIVALIDDFEVRNTFAELEEQGLKSSDEVPPAVQRDGLDVESELVARIFPESIKDRSDYQFEERIAVEPVEEAIAQVVDVQQKEWESPEVALIDDFETRIAHSEHEELLSDLKEFVESEPASHITEEVVSRSSPQPSEVATIEAQEPPITESIIEPSKKQAVEVAQTSKKETTPVTQEKEVPPVELASVNKATVPSEDTSAEIIPTKVAAVQSTSDGLGAANESYTAPQFGVAGLSNPAPRYPYMSRAKNEEGRVVLQVFVDTRGNAKSITIHTSSGHRRLDKAAKKAVRKWKFQPARIAGVLTEDDVLVPINFKLTK